MEKSSKESVEERNLMKVFLAMRGLSCQECRLQQVTCTTVLVVSHLPPIPSQLEKTRILWSDWVQQQSACSIAGARNAMNSQTEWWGRIPSHILLGTIPLKQPRVLLAVGNVVLWSVGACQNPQAFFWLMDPLCAQTNVWGYSSSGEGLCISLCIKLFLKGQNTQNKMLNPCIQFALGGRNVDCCILSPWQSSRWEIVSLNTSTRKWIQMKWCIADDDCYFPLRWNCSMIFGSL